MPLRDDGKPSRVVRLVVGNAAGSRCPASSSCASVMARDSWVTHQDDGAIRAIAGPDMTVLHTPVELRGDNLKSVGKFLVSEERRYLSS